MSDKTKVIFRTWKNDGEVIALFPAIPANVNGTMCVSYMRIGQHGGADYDGCIKATRPAMPREYKDLAAELERIGYDLEIGTRASRRDRAELRAELRRERRDRAELRREVSAK